MAVAPRPIGGFPSSPDLVDPTGTLSVWYTTPPGALVQVSRAARGTSELVGWLVGPALEALLARFPDESLSLVLDLGLMTDRDPAVRSMLMEAGIRLKHRWVSTTIIAPRAATPVYKAALHAAAAVAAVAGIRVYVEPTLAVAIAKRDVRPAGGRVSGSAL